MTNIEVQLINLINNNKSLNEIEDILNLTRKQIYRKLLKFKNNGYAITNEYYYNGDITYLLHSTDKVSKNIENNVIINMPDKENTFKAIVISDIHIGCDKQGLNALNYIYDYCIKNNIHIILNAGDLIDGWFGQNKKLNKDIEHQLQYLIKKYPFDKNILNFICLGNHDLNSYQKFGIDLKIILANYRHDLVAFASGIGHVHVKNDDIILCHPINHNKSKFSEIEDSIIFKGHHHKYATDFNEFFHNHIICIPTLSNIFLNNQFPLPSALEIEFTINSNGKFTEGIVNQLIFVDNNLIKINEMKISNFHKKYIQNNNNNKKSNKQKNENSNKSKKENEHHEYSNEQSKVYTKIKNS